MEIHNQVNLIITGEFEFEIDEDGSIRIGNPPLDREEPAEDEP